MYDLIILGAGPAGLTSAMYAARKKLKVIVLSRDVGGQALLTSDIENYPGFNIVTGQDLIKKFEEHVEEYGVEIDKDINVERINKKENHFEIFASGKNYETKAIIIATGRVKRELNIPGSKEFLGKGISTLMAYNANLFKDKNVAVVGGGNSAVNVALTLINYASNIYIIEKNDDLNADAVSIDKLNSSGKVNIMKNRDVTEILGDSTIRKIKIKDLKTNEESFLDVEGVFIEIGYVASTDFISNLVNTNEKNEIVVDVHNSTNVPGIFAAGDVTNVLEKQIIVAAGEGAKAALSVYEYLKKNNMLE